MGSPLPLIALRAFAEVARTGSIKSAAEALGVTPGAVSQQVRGLEAWLGAPLLERRNRRVLLTDAGLGLARSIGDSFLAIEAAASTFRQRKVRDLLVVTTCGGLAASWLLPRLDAFRALHPEIEIRLESTARIVDLHCEPVDVALRPGRDIDPALVAERFFSPHLVPVAHPDLLAAGPPVTTARDLLRHTLLQDAARTDWVLWLRAPGVEDARAGLGPTFDDPFLAAQAALRGQGVALVWDIYIRDDLAAGRLVPVLPSVGETPFGYYFVTLPSAARLPKVRAFHDWLFAEVDKIEPFALAG